MSASRAPASQTFKVFVQTSVTKEDKENDQLFLYGILSIVSLACAALLGHFLVFEFDAAQVFVNGRFWLVWIGCLKLFVFGFSTFSIGTVYATEDTNFLNIALILNILAIIYDIVFIIVIPITFAGVVGGLPGIYRTAIIFAVICMVTQIIVAVFLYMLIHKADEREGESDAIVPTGFLPQLPATEEGQYEPTGKKYTKSKSGEHFKFDEPAYKKQEEYKTASERKKFAKDYEKGENAHATVHNALEASTEVDEAYNWINIFILVYTAVGVFYFGNFLALEFEPGDAYNSTSAPWWLVWAAVGVVYFGVLYAVLEYIDFFNNEKREKYGENAPFWVLWPFVWIVFSLVYFSFPFWSIGQFLAAGWKWWLTWLNVYKIPFLFVVLWANGRTRVTRGTIVLSFARVLLILSVFYNLTCAIVYTVLFNDCSDRICTGNKSAFVTLLMFQWGAIGADLILIATANVAMTAIRKRNRAIIEISRALKGESQAMRAELAELAQSGWFSIESIASSVSKSSKCTCDKCLSKYKFIMADGQMVEEGNSKNCEQQQQNQKSKIVFSSYAEYVKLQLSAKKDELVNQQQQYNKML